MNPEEMLKRGENAAREQRYDEALADYIWLHEHALEDDSALYGVRLSFALAAWRELGELYPPAIEALLSIRDQKVRAMLGGAPDLGTFDDVAAISHYLGDVRVTYEVFLSLHERHPELARSCASIAMPALIHNGDFKLARAFFTDPELSIRRWSSNLNAEISNRERLVHGGFIRLYVERVSEVLQVLLGVGEIERAAKVRALALASVNDESTVRVVSERLPASRDPA
jgi:hypothetical protein